MSMRPRTAAFLMTLLASVLLFGIAASANAESPGLDQYVETIPDANGNPNATDGNKDGGGGGGGGDGDGSSTSGPGGVDPRPKSSCQRGGHCGSKPSMRPAPSREIAKWPRIHTGGFMPGDGCSENSLSETSSTSRRQRPRFKAKIGRSCSNMRLVPLP